MRHESLLNAWHYQWERGSENPSPETDDNPMAVIMDSIMTAAEYCVCVNPYVSPNVFWSH